MAGAAPGALWTFGYAATTFTADEARAALALLPSFLPLTPSPPTPVCWDVGLPDGYVGHAYLLAGKTDEALPYLKRAAASCTVFASAFALMRATLDLGIALESNRDKDGACAAYGTVLARWGKAKPRSVTADDARKRATALRCAR